MSDRQTIYCVGGGLSLKGFDFSRLDGKRVVAVTRSFEVLPNAEVVYFTDERFYRWFYRALMLHQGRKITGASRKVVNRQDIENWILVRRSGLEREYGYLASGNNSGYAAINVAYHLGAKRIVLLGYDMTAPEDDAGSIQKMEQPMHWHNGYEVSNRKNVFSKMRPYFDGLAEELDKDGIEVLNANPNSVLECFKKVNLDEVLEPCPEKATVS